MLALLSYVWKLALATLALSVASFLFHYVPASRRPRNYPPGPPGLPIIGNIHQFPLKKLWLQFHEWQKEYGPVMGLKLGPLNLVILSSYKPVKELFDKRGTIYSSRPPNYVATELVTPRDAHILFQPYGPEWRVLRKGSVGLLNVTNMDELLPLQFAESCQTMYDIMQTPEKWFNHFRRYGSAVILEAVFGIRGAKYDDPNISAFYEVSEEFTNLLALGATPPVDAFPFLKYIPDFLTPYKAQCRDLKVKKVDFFKSLVEQSRARMNRPGTAPCFMHKLLAKGDKSGLTYDQLLYVGGTFMEAGSETSSMMAHLFVLAMIAHPEIFKKAQREVDQMCGTSASPSTEHIEKLPYLQAIMMEIFRWRPAAPGGVPHMLTQDDWYDGYFLPKGTLFLAVTWSIHHDETEYDRPDEFIPERWLDNEFGTKYSVSPEDKDHRRSTYVFGSSRRVCPGQNMGKNSLMLNMAKMTWAFDIKADPQHPPVLDEKLVHGDGFVGEPHDFPAVFTIRSDKHRQVIEQEYERAEEFLRKYED